MLRVLRRLPLSLASKCQLLFGAAGVLTIGAALFVQFQRMEQLTRQLDPVAAGAVLQTLVAEHAQAGAAPTTRPLAFQNGPTLAPPRLLSAERAERLPRAAFEREALDYFRRRPDRDAVPARWTTVDNRAVVEHVAPVRATASCVACHAHDAWRAGLAQLPRPPIVGVASVRLPSQVSAQQVALNRAFLFGGGLLAGLVAVVVLSRIISRLILRPVRVLQVTAEKVGAGDLDVRSDIGSRDEFQQLSETFNRMLINLKQSRDDLAAANRTLDQRLGQMSEANVALYESNRLKTEFLANVSHELRTPLNSILGFADLLRTSDRVAADAKLARYLGNITRSGKGLLDLINDLLDLAKLEAGRVEVRAQPLALGDLFEALAGLLKPLLEAKGLTLKTSVARDVPIVHTDAGKLQQVLYNLLSNAIKFSPPSDVVGLVADLSGDDQVRLEVADNGPGIDAAQHDLIFEKFRQLDASVTREHGGTGLGLAIARELTALLGGAVGVESAPGAGATFWVTLPLRVEPGARDLRRPSDTVAGELALL